MIPAPGDRILRFVGDTVRFQMVGEDSNMAFPVRAMLRTNLGKGARLRREIIETYSGKRPLSVAFWRDIPMQRETDGSWALELPVTEPGYFKAKAYFLDSEGRQSWPSGPDVGLCCHPSSYRTGNTIYCAFTRMFGPSKNLRSTVDAKVDKAAKELDKQGYTVIPPSGKLRDLQRELPHIIDTLGCKILHLLPVNPTPTTIAKFGRFGSPYACQDLLAIDPALVDFDQRTTGIEQFEDLTYAVHALGGRVFLDVVVNHTGWGSTLFENHPEWFLREHDGKFASPGAWGTVWEDLVELNPQFTGLWEHLAEAFLEWCRRGVDGFRCDAGYKVPLPVWQYIEARVRQEFPDTVFLLEGLGGSWEATETLLTEGGMQWAYSELFQNYSGGEVQWYLDYALRQSERIGVYVHYSETHDNERLAKKGRLWSLLRNRLCGLTSGSGGFGFTCGVEWLAGEKVEVHQSRGMNWDAEENIIPELAALNGLLSNHPCFFDGAKITRLSANAAAVFAMERVSAEGKDRVLVLVNTDASNEHLFSLGDNIYKELGCPSIDLLGQRSPSIRCAEGRWDIKLAAGEAYCLSNAELPLGLFGDSYRRARAQASWAVTALSKTLMPEEIGRLDWRALAHAVDQDPRKFLSLVAGAKRASSGSLSKYLFGDAVPLSIYPQVVTWTESDRSRVTLVPAAHWLLITDPSPFRASLKVVGEEWEQHVESIQSAGGHVAFFAPSTPQSLGRKTADARMIVQHYNKERETVTADVRLLAPEPGFSSSFWKNEQINDEASVLLTNGVGGMARLCVDLGRIKSKYDCALGANLHPNLPVDRHVFAKRIRVWVNADGFVTPLNLQNLAYFQTGQPAVWKFVANAGDEREVEIHLSADMLEGRNTTLFVFSRGARVLESVNPTEAPVDSPALSNSTVSDVRLTIRVDIEDRNFHSETIRNRETEHHFSVHTRMLSDRPGFSFAPAQDRQLRVFSDKGFYHHGPEWVKQIAHPIEQSRGQIGAADAFSPGWFDLPLREGQPVSLVLTADANDPSNSLLDNSFSDRSAENQKTVRNAFGPAKPDPFAQRLALAARQFVVRRGHGKTVIAGYPWFLDWGRDTMIAARGLLSAGMTQDVTDLLLTFGRFVENGTMPNTIHGENASNRNTSDAPLWYGILAEEAAARIGESLYELVVDARGRTVIDVLREIAVGYGSGAPNGIYVERESGLVWSPSHFTWMDTNYPAGTPREGFPVEIQVLWIRLLRQLHRRGVAPETEPWLAIADRAERSLQNYYWLEEGGYLADLLVAKRGQSASDAIPDNALRSNYLLAVAFGFVTGERAQRCVEAAQRYLVIPGALRSLAPLPVSPPLPVFAHGRLLNDPAFPYFGRYMGDEDTQRKPAYHNGTGWTWTFPTFCEALVRAWDFSPDSVAAAKSYLGSLERLMKDVSLGQIPENVDGDAPHIQRGCDAQAWGVTEALRVWKLLNVPAGQG